MFIFYVFSIENLTKFDPKIAILVEFTLEKKINQNFLNFFFEIHLRNISSALYLE
jgi:hypothetical protein